MIVSMTIPNFVIIYQVLMFSH